MEVNMEFTCNTVGELKAALENWPDDKPLIIDDEGSTYPAMIRDWSDNPAEDLKSPVIIEPQFR